MRPTKETSKASATFTNARGASSLTGVAGRQRWSGPPSCWRVVSGSDTSDRSAGSAPFGSGLITLLAYLRDVAPFRYAKAEGSRLDADDVTLNTLRSARRLTRFGFGQGSVDRPRSLVRLERQPWGSTA